MKDYKTEEKILDKLEYLQEANQTVRQYDEFSVGMNRMIQDFHEENEEFPKELYETLSILKNKGLTDNEIHTFSTSLLKEGTSYLVEPRKVLKRLKGVSNEIKDEIGELIMEDAKTEGLKEKSVHFKGFGTVTCNLVPTVHVIDKLQFINSLAEDTKFEKYISVSSKALKDKDVLTRKGVVQEDELIVTIRSDAK